MHRSCITLAVASLLALATATAARATLIGGGGSPSGDCVLALDVDGANKPAAPKIPKSVDCVDGDSTCDADGLRNGRCEFPLRLCANSTSFDSCTSDTAYSVVVDHAVDNGIDRRFDTDFQALQSRTAALNLPTMAPDRCTLTSSITVKLRGPDSSNVMKLNRKVLRITTDGATASGPVTDVDTVKFTCRPEGDGVYLPTDLYTGTFDRISQQVFAQTCAVAGCHDSNSHTGNLILLPGSAYSNLVGVTPDNPSASMDSSLHRVTPGDPSKSFLYLKITGNLLPDYGVQMPKDKPALDPSLIEMIRLWIIGDMTNGQAPETGWVPGTDQ
ncbi:MAG TPA: hypothetical protein VGK20_07540 [Candidatus Binatia bacterium]|jgi:hypothetical protein